MEEDIKIIVYSEFRDGFISYSLITNKDRLLLYPLILLLIDLTVDDSMHIYSITLGQKTLYYN